MIYLSKTFLYFGADYKHKAMIDILTKTQLLREIHIMKSWDVKQDIT